MVSAPKTLTKNSGNHIFAFRFLRSLSKIKTNRPLDQNPDNNSNNNQDQETRKRVQKIKMAAYSSMARTAGTSRAWSRALLSKIRRQGKLRNKQNKVQLKSRRVRKNGRSGSRDMTRQEAKLRKLVPGGKAMEICSLMEETADYIRCLNMQVKVMHEILDSLST